jgi:flagellin
MRINQNIAAFNAYRNLSNTQLQQNSSLEKLSSGFRINRAADDASGLVRSENLRSEVGGLKVAIRNAQDGISVIQTAEGALTESHSILQRMRDLAVQSSNTGANNDESLAANQAEFDQLALELDRIASDTKFGGKELLDGSYTGVFQLGAHAGQNETVAIGGMDSATLGVATAGADADDPNVAIALDADAVALIDGAIEKVSAQRSELGAFQNRFESTIRNISVTVENLSAAESRIRDTDMAEEMVNFTRSQILSQAGTAMLAQANQVPQSVLSLLR